MSPQQLLSTVTLPFSRHLLHYLYANDEHRRSPQFMDPNLALSQAKEAAEAALSRERAMRIQLDMQVQMSRELETRLEQALSGWKTEKRSAKESSARVVELKTSSIEAKRVIETLREENLKLEQRLRLYDRIPLPVCPDYLHFPCLISFRKRFDLVCRKSRRNDFK